MAATRTLIGNTDAGFPVEVGTVGTAGLFRLWVAGKLYGTAYESEEACRKLARFLVAPGDQASIESRLATR